jgi:murein L,D-transpeptidase YcbB/YkuD
VVGEPGHETPELGSPLYRLVANPTWTVPRSIEEREIAPKGEAYLRRNRMTRRDGWIVQESGPRNSLGLVKFDLRNDQEIYLHDTPAKGLFAHADRHASHGCVRVADALGFARMIAADQGVEEQWRDALATGEETFVPLPRPIPVRLLYHNVFVDHGRILFAPDVYGWDEDVAEALGLPRRPRPPAAARGRDLGP